MFTTNLPLTVNHTQLGSIQLEVDETFKMSRERVDLAKALIRASEKPSKPSKGSRSGAASKGGEANDSATGDSKGGDTSA